MGSGHAHRDVNREPVLIGVSNSDLSTAVEVAVDPSTHRLLVQTTGGGGGGDGAILDGAVDSIRATVKDLSNSNPLTVAIVDGSGDQISSFGGGTQYTEDAAAAANPVGTALNMVRDDARSGSITSTDGDNIAARGTNSGELYVKHVDAIPVTDNGGSLTVDGTVTANIGTVGTLATAAKQDTGNTSVASIDTKTPTLGQALAAASVPVVLTAAQISTITPPAAITGFATAAAQTDKSQFTKLTDGTDTALITAAGEQNVIATAQPGVDIGDVTINNASGAAAVNVQDGGNSLTVDNGGTFPVQATLAAETTKVIGTVNQGTSPWVTSNATTSVVGNGAAATAQRVTLANDSTGVIATVGAVTAITNALPAGTNAIGKLAANSGVDIGDVDVTSVTPGTTATSLGKAEDAAHTTGDVGVMSLAVRNDAAAPLAGTTGDYIPVTTDEVGAQWFATVGRVSTANSTAVNLANGAVFTGTSEEVKNYAAIQVSIFSSHASATDGLSLQQSSDGTNWDIVDTYSVAAATGKVFSVQPASRFFRLVYTNGATLTTSLRIQTVYHTDAPNPSSQRPADTYTNETDLTQQWAFCSFYNGATWDRMRGDTTNGLDVDVTRIIPGTTATSLGKAEDATAASGDTLVGVAGVRNDTLAIAQTNANGDYSSIATDTSNRVMVAAAPRALKTTQQTTITSSTSETTVLTAVASTFLDVYGVIVTNTSATVTKVTFKDSTTGTTRFVIEVPATDTRGFMLPLDAAHPQATVNTNWTATCGTSVASVEITMLAVKMLG